MKIEIEILKHHLGSYQAVAEALGITERHLRNVMINKHTGEPIKRLIKSLLESVKQKPSGGTQPPKERAA